MFVVLWSSYQCWYPSALWYLSDPFCSVLKKKRALKTAYHLQFHHSQSVSCSRAWSPGCNIYKVRLGLPAAAIWPRGLQLTPDGTYLPEIHSNKFISVISLLWGILTDARAKSFPPNNSECFKTDLDNAFFYKLLTSACFDNNLTSIIFRLLHFSKSAVKLETHSLTQTHTNMQNADISFSFECVFWWITAAFRGVINGLQRKRRKPHLWSPEKVHIETHWTRCANMRVTKSSVCLFN